MDASAPSPIDLRVVTRKWPLRAPFFISGYRFTAVDIVTVTLGDAQASGRGEAAGVYYHAETPATLTGQIDAVREAVEAGADRQDLLRLLPAGGARNAVDCALWELESCRAGQPVRELAGLPKTRPLQTTYTLGADEPGIMAEKAKTWSEATALKLKLTGTPEDAERVRAVRRARPEAWLMVDANQGFTPDSLHALMPALSAADVQLIEQPFPIDHDVWMDDLQSPIRIAADESFQDHHDFDRVAGRFAVVNVKLDKCGGLTEALAIAAEAKRRGFGLMVGNMGGTSRAMAPAFLLGQLCEVADLDGPLQFEDDCTPGVCYRDGEIHCADRVWGFSATP